MKLNINGKEVEVSDEDLSKALEEKVDTFEVKAESLTIRSEEEETSFKENLRKEGIATGAEIGRKEVLKGFELEGDGLHKSDATAIDAIKGLMKENTDAALKDANIEPDKKVAELEKDLGTLRTTIDTQEKTIADKELMFSSFKKQQTMESAFADLIPDNGLLPNKDLLTIMKANIKADVDDNGNVFGIGADGQPIKDSTLNVLPMKEVVSTFFNDNPHLLKKAEGGGGGDGGDSGGDGGKQSLEDFTKEMNDAGHQTNGEEFNKQLQERIKAETVTV